MATSLQWPVPDSDTVCGLDEALSLISSVADSDFFAVGLNVTVIVHEAFGFIELGQRLLWLKSEFPLMLMLLISNGVTPVLVSVTVLVALWPSLTSPKLMLDSFSLALGSITVPVRPTVTGLLGRL